MKRKAYTMRSEVRDNQFFTALKIVFKVFVVGDLFEDLHAALFKTIDFREFSVRVDPLKRTIVITGIVNNSLTASAVTCLIRERLISL